MPYTLIAHPDYPAPAGFEVEVDIDLEGNGLSLIYGFFGDDRDVMIGSGTDGSRQDGLWQHTCFEAFIRSGDGEGYIELNFAPTGEWAAYAFDRHREGMRNLPVTDRPFALRGTRQAWWADGSWWSFSTGNIFDPTVDWQVGLAAVIEANDGTKSYWALDHAPGPPDFHNPACFKLRFTSAARP